MQSRHCIVVVYECMAYFCVEARYIIGLREGAGGGLVSPRHGSHVNEQANYDVKIDVNELLRCNTLQKVTSACSGPPDK